MSWALKTSKLSKLRKYRLTDNYLRFYFKFIFPKIHAINKSQYVDVPPSQLPGWIPTLGLQFENLVLNNRDLVIRALNITPAEIVMDDPYFQKATVRQKGCQIDYLIQTKLNTLFVCEIKFSNKKISAEVIKQIKDKIDKLALPRGFSVLPVLIHFGDLSEEIDAQDFFYKIIDFREFF